MSNEPRLFTDPPAAAPELASYDVILINTSAGKDSQAMMDYVVTLATEAGARERVVALHCDLGVSPKGNPIEWPGTKELAAEHSAHYGLRFIVVKRGVRGFLEEIKERGQWPSNSQRYCTSYFKRDQGSKVLTQLADELRSGSWPAGFLEMVRQRYCTDRTKTQPGQAALVALADEKRTGDNKRPRILNCYGFRAEESPRRKKLPQFAVNKRSTNSRKHVDDWLPIQGWTLEQVWARIRAAGTRHHPAYELGMPRLSCTFCIFAPKAALMIAGKARPELLQEYVDVERETGHRFRMELSLVEVQEAINRGEEAGPVDGAWNM